MGHFNRQTGEVEVSAFNRQRIKAAAQAAGLDYSNVMEMVFSNARGGEIARQAGGRGIFANQDNLNLLKNVGTIEKNGVAGAYLTRNGKQEFVKAQEMTEKDIQELVAMSKSDSDNIQDIAKTLRGWDDVISGTKKQIEGAKAQAVETTGIGKKVQNIVNIVGQSNAILKTIAITSIVGGALGAAGGA
jgi:malonyl CoA-acyl carrier protein transacylase